MSLTLQIDPRDNVRVALSALQAGEQVDGLTLANDIPAGHKIALSDIPIGAPVIKYGYPIGVANQAITRGQHVHEHNVKSALADRLESLRYADVHVSSNVQHLNQTYTFHGYRRPDGRAATRNEIWIVNTVGCVNHASTRIAEQAMRANLGVDGVYAFPHPFGCSQLGDDLLHTQKVLAGLVNHPNAAAVLILGLGCENNQMKLFLEQLGPTQRERIRYFNAQEVADEIESGMSAVNELAEYAKQFKRETINSRELITGMKCGGSDGFSGITANPLVGQVANQLTTAGSTVLLTEVPEMFGAERVLLERTTDETVFKKTIDLVNDFRAYFQKYNEPIDENPSPGNRAGGITTLAEKSLGCVQKGGRAPVKQVLAYGEQASAGLGGLALINAPGNDGVSCTAMTVAGAHVLLFTTGRGTPMGFPVPTIKIASNSDLASRKPAWIDFNAGALTQEGANSEDLAGELTRLVLEIASGNQQAKNERNGHREIAIWKDGVTL